MTAKLHKILWVKKHSFDYLRWHASGDVSWHVVIVLFSLPFSSIARSFLKQFLKVR